jgi:hypothetical protein
MDHPSKSKRSLRLTSQVTDLAERISIAQFVALARNAEQGERRLGEREGALRQSRRRYQLMAEISAR